MSPGAPEAARSVALVRGSLGRAGEDAAAGFYRSLGYRVEMRNVRVGRVELDLVLRKGPDVVFCEVKTRRGAVHGLPEEAVDARKRRRLLRAAEGYLARRPVRGRVRFDVISVTCGAEGGLDLRLVEDAFRTW